MNALMNMSHTTWYAEQLGKSCRFDKTWSPRLVSEEGNALVEEMPEIDIDITDFAPPQELKLAEERKLVAY